MCWFPQDPGVCHRYFRFNFHFTSIRLELVLFQKQPSTLISHCDALISFLPFGCIDMSMSLIFSGDFFWWLQVPYVSLRWMDAPGTRDGRSCGGCRANQNNFWKRVKRENISFAGVPLSRVRSFPALAVLEKWTTLVSRISMYWIADTVQRGNGAQCIDLLRLCSVVMGKGGSGWRKAMLDGDMRPVFSGIRHIFQLSAALFSSRQPSPVSGWAGFMSALRHKLWVQTAGSCPQFWGVEGQPPRSPWQEADATRCQALPCPCQGWAARSLSLGFLGVQRKH